jgi:hypothetical protein
VPSKVDLANRALTKVGDDRLTSIGEDSEPGRVVRASYDIVRDAVLREYPWNFAKRRAALASSLPAPAYKYDYAYQLPADFLRLLEIQGQTGGYGDWEIVGRRIEINASGPLRITYVASVDDPNQYDALFVEAFCTRLAAEICHKLSDDVSLGNRLEDIYRDLLTRAAMADAKEGPPKRLPNGSWLDSRIGDFR